MLKIVAAIKYHLLVMKLLSFFFFWGYDYNLMLPWPEPSGSISPYKRAMALDYWQT